MIRPMLLFAFAAPLLAQQGGEAPLTQTLITEIRALRQQLEATMVTSQRVQIALYRMQSQTTLVADAQHRFDTAHGRVADIQKAKRDMAGESEAVTERIRNTTDPAQKRDFESHLARYKTEI